MCQRDKYPTKEQKQPKAIDGSSIQQNKIPHPEACFSWPPAGLPTHILGVHQNNKDKGYLWYRRTVTYNNCSFL